MKLTKKILSLVLAAALLLGTVAIAANAEGLTAYEGSQLTYVITSDKTVDGVTQAKPGETINFQVYMTTNYYTGPSGGEFFLFTANVFETFAKTDLAISGIAAEHSNTVVTPTATRVYPSTHGTSDYVGFHISRAFSADYITPRVIDNELIYEFSLTVLSDDSLIGTTATIELPEGSIKSTSQTGTKGMIYQSVSSSTETKEAAKNYSETVDLTAAKLTISIVGEAADPCDYTALDAAIATAEALVEDEYTPNSWAAADVATVLAAGKALDRNLTVDEAGANQNLIDTKTKAITDAIALLVKKADKTALVAAINTEVDKTDCTSASVAAYDSALAAANEVNDDANVDQATVDNATNALNAAIAGLTKLGNCDYTALDAAIALTPEMEKDYYDADDYAAWEAALAEAKAVERDMVADEAGVNQATIKAATDELTAAYAALVPSVLDISVLTDAIAASSSPAYSADYYDADDYAAWEAALAAAQAGVTTYTGAADTEANRAAVQSLADDLTAAYDALVPAFLDLSELEKAVKDCSTPAYSEDYYDATAYDTWKYSLESGKNILEYAEELPDTENNRAAVKNAVNQLTSAYDALVPAFVDLSELEKAVADCSTPAYGINYYNTSDYIAWNIAYTNAEKGLTTYAESPDTQAVRESVQDLTDTLTSAYAALVPAFVDVSPIEQAVANCSTPAYSEEYYDADAYAAWAAALAEAEYALAYEAENPSPDIEIAREAVQSVADELTSAYAALVPNFLDYSSIEKALAECVAEHPEAYYTAETWEYYTRVYNGATESLNFLETVEPQLPDTEQYRANVETVVTSLVDAYNALTPVGSSVIRVTALSPKYSKDDVVNFEVEVQGIEDVSKIQFLTSAGKTLTYAKSSSSVLSITTNEAGNTVWVVSTRIYTDENATMYARAKNGNIWETGYFAFDITPEDFSDYSVKSAEIKVEGKEVITNTDTVTITIVTGADVTRIRLSNPENGSTLTYSNPASVNLDGTKVWVINRVYKTVKDYDLDILVRSENTAWEDSGVNLTFSVVKYVPPQLPSTGLAEDAVYSAAPAKARILKGSTQVFNITTDQDAKAVRILNSSGEVVAKATASVSNADGVAAWEISMVYNVIGTYNYTVEALYGSTWLADDDGAMTFTVLY